MGNRVMKIEGGVGNIDAVYTYYVYDASGNVMATYSREITPIIGAPEDEDFRDEISLTERMIYGSKRVGIKNENRVLAHFDFTPAAIDEDGYYQAYASTDAPVYSSSNFENEKRKVGEKFYEFSNHLGNVLEVTTDRKIANTGLTAYEADIISYSDYSPYGTTLDGRNGNTPDYRYGFQGQEKDDEIKDIQGSSINYKYRMHDPRIGRFFATDPLEPKYPFYSPYSFSGNRVIDAVELEGLEPSTNVSVANPTYEVDHDSQVGSTLAEGDLVEVGTNFYVNHCGVSLPDGSVEGAGLYEISDYIDFAFDYTDGYHPQETQSWSHAYYRYRDYQEIGAPGSSTFYYKGVDGKSGLSPVLQEFIWSNTAKFCAGGMGFGEMSDDGPLVFDLVLGTHGLYTLGRSGLKYLVGKSLSVPKMLSVVNSGVEITANLEAKFLYRHGGEMTVMQHIIKRHAYGTTFQGVSKFYEGTSEDLIKKYIYEAVENGAPILKPGNGSYYIRYDTGKAIGYASDGSVTSEIMIYISDGYVKTAFPIK